MAKNQVEFWFRQSVSLGGSVVLRLFFIFEMLISAFDFRRSQSLVSQSPRASENPPLLYSHGWDGDNEVQGWHNTLKWWVGKCGFCAGRGLEDSRINHSLSNCRRGGSLQRSIRMCEAIFSEGFKAQGGCARCGVPREFCDRWAKSSDGVWQEQPLQRCQYGRLVYDTVVELYQCTDTRYAFDLLTTIEEEGEDEYRDLDDEDVTMWLCRKLVVADIEGAEILRQLWVWTQMIQKTRLEY